MSQAANAPTIKTSATRHPSTTLIAFLIFPRSYATDLNITLKRPKTGSPSRLGYRLSSIADTGRQSAYERKRGCIVKGRASLLSRHHLTPAAAAVLTVRPNGADHQWEKDP